MPNVDKLVLRGHFVVWSNVTMYIHTFSFNQKFHLIKNTCVWLHPNKFHSFFTDSPQESWKNCCSRTRILELDLADCVNPDIKTNYELTATWWNIVTIVTFTFWSHLPSCYIIVNWLQVSRNRTVSSNYWKYSWYLTFYDCEYRLWVDSFVRCICELSALL